MGERCLLVCLVLQPSGSPTHRWHGHSERSPPLSRKRSMGPPGRGIFLVEVPLSQMTVAYVQLIENYDIVMAKLLSGSCYGLKDVLERDCLE